MALDKSVRLQKFLSQAGVASRRKAEELIKAGRISVDGTVITEMGHKIDPSRQVIRCDNAVITATGEDYLYILLNKPKGYVTTLADPQGRPVVTSLLKNIKTRVFPVGRLDIDTEGALLLTNDGELAHKILHPSHETNKTYEAVVQGSPSRETLAKLERGVMLEGKMTWPAKLKIAARSDSTTTIRIIIHEGRKRQVRKMFQVVGHPVVNLKRLAYGQLALGSLKTGSYRIVSERELKMIFL